MTKHKRHKSESFKALSARGVRFLKYGVKRKPQITLVRIKYVDKIPEMIVWGEGNKYIALEEIKLVAHGCVTRAFVGKIDDSVDPHCCFSIIPLNSNSSLDLQAASPQIAQRWVRRLRKMIGQTSKEAQILSNSVLAETLAPAYDYSEQLESISSLPSTGIAPPKRKFPDKKVSRHVKTASLGLSNLHNEEGMFQTLFFQCIRDLDRAQRDDVRRVIHPKNLYKTCRHRKIHRNQWKQFILDEVGWALRTDMPVSMSPFRMNSVERIRLEVKSPDIQTELIRQSAVRFMELHSLPDPFTLQDFQLALKNMRIIITDIFSEEVFDFIIEDGFEASVSDLACFFEYTWSHQIEEVKKVILQWLEAEVNQDLESQMRSALKEGKRFSTLQLQLNFGKEKDLNVLKQLYNRILEEEDNKEEVPDNWNSTVALISVSEQAGETSHLEQKRQPKLLDRADEFTDTAPRSKAGTVVESYGDPDASTTDTGNLESRFLVPEIFSATNSESKTESSKRDPSNNSQSVESQRFAKIMDIQTTIEKENESDSESIEIIRRSESVLEHVRSVSSQRCFSPDKDAMVGGTGFPPSISKEAQYLETRSPNKSRLSFDDTPTLSMASVPENYLLDGVNLSPTHTPLQTSALAGDKKESNQDHEGLGYLFMEEKDFLDVDNRDYDRRITEGAGLSYSRPQMLGTSYSRGLADDKGASLAEYPPPPNPPEKRSSSRRVDSKVSVGIYELLDAKQKHSLRNSRSSTLNKFADQVVNGIPGKRDSAKLEAGAPVKYCKLEESTNTAITVTEDKMMKASDPGKWSMNRDIWMACSLLSVIDVCSDVYLACSILARTNGWVALFTLVLGFRAILLAWVLPNYTPFYEHPINIWSLISTWCPFSAVWHSAVPFPPRSSEELVQGLLHQLCVEFVLIPIFTFAYIPFLIFVASDSMQWTTSVFEERYMFWNLIQLFECVPMLCIQVVLLGLGFTDSGLILSMVCSLCNISKSTYVFMVYGAQINSKNSGIE